MAPIAERRPTAPYQRRRNRTVTTIGRGAGIDLAALGRQIAERGPASCERRLAELACTARLLGFNAVAVDVMVDRDASVVTRARAFAVVASALGAQRVGDEPSARAIA
jgi:hypothetical protein